MSVVAKVFSRLFYGNPDLVISDIVAGFILLAAVQAYEEHQEVLATSLHDEEEESKNHRASFQASASKPKTLHDAVTINTGIVNTSNIDQSSHVVSIDVPSSNDADARFQHANKTFYYHPADPHLRDVELIEKLQEMAHYSKYAIGIYGWMLYVWSHPWSGTFRLAFSCLRRHVSYVHGDNWFHLSQTALQLETKLHRDDIVYASFQNSVYQPAFAVMLDHKQQDVVIAIRGTLSLEDCLTDVMAYGMSMDDIARRWHCDGVGEFAHQGFLTCAEAIYLELNRLGILDMLFDHNSMTAIATHHVQECERGLYRHYGLVITGHSLGAGAACLLAVLMRSKYPRVRCFAFSPPGCTMSRGLASRCALFTNSVVVGDDIIARSSLTSAEALRDHVLDLIGRSKVNKTAILRQVLSWRHPDDLLHQNTANHSALDSNVDGHSPFVAHLLNYRTMLKRIQESEPIHELTIPGRVVHLKRVVQAKRAAGCWVCCRFGGGGMCCTARTKYRFAWAAAGQFSRIRIGRTMLDDHFPDKVHYVLQDCVQRMQTRKPQYD